MAGLVQKLLLLPCYHANFQLSQTQFSLLEPTLLEKDWSGLPAQHTFKFVLAVDKTFVVLAAKIYGRTSCDESLERGAFIEGLWERDVVELFLKDDENEEYQEFNLSPAGAWWSAHFSSYRVRKRVLDTSCKVEIFIERDPEFCSLILCIPKGCISIRTGFSERSQANICAVLGTNPRQFLSAGVLPSEKPDFHLAAHFPRLEVRPVDQR